MSHEKRMHMIDEKGAGGFALEEGNKLDSDAVERIQETVDVSEIVAKYDKESRSSVSPFPPSTCTRPRRRPLRRRSSARYIWALC